MDSSERETLYLLSIPGMRESIRQGMEEPLAECAAQVDWEEEATLSASGEDGDDESSPLQEDSHQNRPPADEG